MGTAGPWLWRSPTSLTSLRGTRWTNSTSRTCWAWEISAKCGSGTTTKVRAVTWGGWERSGQCCHSRKRIILRGQAEGTAPRSAAGWVISRILPGSCVPACLSRHIPFMQETVSPRPGVVSALMGPQLQSELTATTAAQIMTAPPKQSHPTCYPNTPALLMQYLFHWLVWHFPSNLMLSAWHWHTG